MLFKKTSSSVLNYGLALTLFFYLFLIVALVISLCIFIEVKDLKYIFESEEISYSFFLSLMTATISSFLSIIFAIPIGYLLSRKNFFGRKFAEALIDIPIILPPLVVGLSLLVFFNQTLVGLFFEKHVGEIFQSFSEFFPCISSFFGLEKIQGITYDLPAIVLAQFTVVCAFAIRTMRLTFDQIDPKYEEVARVLGLGPLATFIKVSVPLSLKGIYTSLALAWARSLGEFGPILIFAGTTRMYTEVVPTTIFLEFSTGNLGASAAVSLLLIFISVSVLFVSRFFGVREFI